MKQGQTAYRDGVQCALFPLDVLWCTQIPDPDSYSHCCGTPTDWIGTSPVYPYYAPFDCHRIYLDPINGEARYLSDTEVWTPTGKRFLITEFLHDDNIPTKDAFRQGELIGHTGTTGYVTGDHVHLDQCAGSVWRDVPSGRWCHGTTWECYEVENGLMPNAAYYITGDEVIYNTMGLNFTQIDPSGHKLKTWIMGAALEKRRKNENGRYKPLLRL